MAKQIKSKKSSAAPKTTRGPGPSSIETDDSDEDQVARDVDRQAFKRKRLLARVAGHVAGGVVQDPSPSATSAAGIAEISVDIAEAILQKVGL